MTPAQALDYLFALPRFTDQGASAYRPGLARMTALMEAMGHPHRAWPSVHVAGTNGKGSTASMIAAIGTAAGWRVGLHTSPHLFHLTERMRVDGVPAPEDWLAGAVDRFRAVMDAVQPSFFEATVALSFLYFAEQRVDWAVVEVGLGGRLDATNMLQPALAVITGIGLDHTDLLGSTLPEIAREKAGIVKPGVPVLTAVNAPGALDVIRETAADRGAPCHVLQEETEREPVENRLDGLVLNVRTPLRHYDRLVAGLPGMHQATNAGLALRAAELVFEPVRQDEGPVRAGLRDVRRLAGLRGRLDVLHRQPLVVADVAHNPDGLATALRFARSAVGSSGQLHVLFGAMRDKDVEGMARLLAEAEAVVTPVPLDAERAVSVAELIRLLTRCKATLAAAQPVPDRLAHFLRDASPADALLITGSHQVVAQLPESAFTSNTNFP